ncbi:MAG: UDP-3-O-(3-hydroxymyristoyl)glucosamine N-acyltransferase [Phycisphaerales bacterium]|nr:UDP-3-O-(3-hydroxymyristoyl)glucosamine N-acyltransferase [Phycisphaerales bacterium]
MTPSNDLTMSAGRIAGLLGGELRGNPDVVIRDAGTLDEAGPDALSWVGKPEYVPKLATTRAGAVLVPRGTVAPEGTRAALILVDDPDLAFCELLRRVAPPAEPVPPGVDPTARILSGAEVDGAHIGPGVYVGARASVGPRTQLHAGVWLGSDVRIGADCVLWPNVVVRERCRIGGRVVIHANSVLGTDGFGYLQRGGVHHKIPQVGIVVVEDDVEIGSCVCVDRARSGATVIGRGTKIDNLVQIGHNVRIGEQCVIVSQTGISGSVTLGRHVVTGGQVGIADHLTIGDGAVLAAQAGLTKDVPPGTTVIGSPAMERGDFVRQIFAGRKVADLAAQVRELKRRLEALERTGEAR